MFSVPISLLLPGSLAQMFVVFWFVVVNNLLVFIFFCKNKREKVQELKYLFSGLSF